MVDGLAERTLLPSAPWVLCSHALQQMSKGLGWHLVHGVMVVGYFVAVLFTEYSALRVGAAGLDLFQRVTYLNLVFITIAGVGSFSVCIAAERESGTLDLLRLSGLGPIGFLVGRWLPLLLGCSLLLLLQIPCTSLAVTLGGVLPGQIRSMTVVSLVHLFLVASVGLLISVFSKTSQRAVVTSFVVFGVWFSGPAAVAGLMRWAWPNSNLPGLDAVLSAFRSISAFGITDRLFGSYQTSPPLWSIEQTCQTLIGLTALGVSCLAFERVAASAPVALARATTSRSRRRWGNGAMALFWKDFHLTAGGWRWFVLRLVAYPTVGLCYGYSTWGPLPIMAWSVIHEAALRMVGWDTAIVLAQLFQREVREQTWDALRFLPRSRCQIGYTKLAGALLALSPGWAWAAFVSFYLASFGQFMPNWTSLLFFASIVVVGCHVTTLVSVLIPRFTWTVPLLLGVVAAHLELEFSRSLTMSFGLGVLSTLLLGSMVVSAVLHGLIAWRIWHLSD